MTGAAQEPGELLARFYAAESSYLSAPHGQGDFGPIGDTLHDECVMVQPQSLPYAGEWRGHAGYRSWMDVFGQAWASLSVTDSRLYLADAETVFSRSTVVATARATGQDISYPPLQMIAISDGRIRRIEPFYWDTHQVLATLGEIPAPHVEGWRSTTVTSGASVTRRH